MGDKTSLKKRIRTLCIFIILTFLCLIFAKYVLTHRNSSKDIHPAIAQMMETLNIYGCTLTSLADYDDIRVTIETPTITEEEYAGYIQTQHQEEDTDLTDDKLRHQLLEEKKIQCLMQARNKVMDTLLSHCRFSLKEESVAAYSKTIVHNYETEAMLYDMDISQYRQKILGYTKEQFYETCYKEGEEAIKTFLIIGAIAEKEFPDLAREPDSKNIYLQYQEIENAVYSYFILTDKDF